MNQQFNHRKAALLHDAPHMARLAEVIEEVRELVNMTRAKLHSDEAVRCVRELDETLSDAVHDCSLKYVRDLTAAGGEL